MSSPRTRREPPHHDTTKDAGGAAQWVGVFLGPATFLAHLQVAYVLVPFACSTRGGDIWVHLAAALSLVLAAIGIVAAHRAWSRAGRGVPGEGGDPDSRARFLGATGLGISAMCFLILAAQWVEALVISTCQ